MEILTLEELKKNMKREIGNFTDKELKTILESLNEDFDNFKDILYYWDGCDLITLTDASLYSIIRYFTSAGYEAEAFMGMLNMSEKGAGNVIELYYCKDDGIYVAVTGHM